MIKKKMPWKLQRKNIKFITDEQAVLVQGNDIMLIGKGEAVTI